MTVAKNIIFCATVATNRDELWQNCDELWWKHYHNCKNYLNLTDLNLCPLYLDKNCSVGIEAIFSILSFLCLFYFNSIFSRLYSLWYFIFCIVFPLCYLKYFRVFFPFILYRFHSLWLIYLYILIVLMIFV